MKNPKKNTKKNCEKNIFDLPMSSLRLSRKKNSGKLAVSLSLVFVTALMMAGCTPSTPSTQPTVLSYPDTISEADKKTISSYNVDNAGLTELLNMMKGIVSILSKQKDENALSYMKTLQEVESVISSRNSFRDLGNRPEKFVPDERYVKVPNEN